MEAEYYYEVPIVRACETEYGFKFGPATVERLFSDRRDKSVCIGIKTPRATLDIYITRTGKVRVFKRAIRRGKQCESAEMK